jgi:uncharacterized membrane protein
LFSLVAQLLFGVGLALCLVPGIYLAVCWFGFGPLLVMDKKLDFWPAMELSRKVVTKHWWSFFGLALVNLLIMAAGILACGIGIFISMPIIAATTVYAYQDIFGKVSAPVVAALPQSAPPPPSPSTPQNSSAPGNPPSPVV